MAGYCIVGSKLNRQNKNPIGAEANSRQPHNGHPNI